MPFYPQILLQTLDLFGYAGGDLEGGHFAVNTGFGVIGLYGGPYGVIGAGAYFLIDTYYPGGLGGALSVYARTLRSVRQYDPTFNPHQP
jgi:hypothetical protein